MHLEQVLVDGEELCVLDLLHEVGKVGRVVYFKLLLRVLVLLHVQAIFYQLVPLDVQFLILAPERVNQPHLLLQVQGKREESHDAEGIGRLHDRDEARDLRVFEDECE